MGDRKIDNYIGADLSGWAQSGEMTSGNVNKKVSLAVDFVKTGQKVAGYYTVTFGIVSPQGGPISVEADISWKTAGNDVTRRISVVNGAAISGTAEACKVIISDVTNTDIYPGPVLGKNYVVSALIAPGTRPSQNQPPRLTPREVSTYAPGGATFPPGVFDIPAGGSQVIDIPDGAGVISVNVEVIGAPPINAPLADGDLLVVFGTNGGGTLSGGGFTPVGNQGAFVPLPPGAGQLVLANTTGAKDILAVVTYGIEG